MNHVRAVRPLVSTISLPRGAAFEDLAKGLVEKQNPDDLARVSHFGYGRYEIKAKSEKIAQEFASDRTIVVKGEEYKLNYLGYRTMSFITQ